MIFETNFFSQTDPQNPRLVWAAHSCDQFHQIRESVLAQFHDWPKGLQIHNVINKVDLKIKSILLSSKFEKDESMRF